ncbi:MAG: hypothetical protein ACXACG_14055 [Candidatus Thorarchaeota archaeon]|jgi:hypothetical protein
MKKAILIAANPLAKFDDGEFGVLGEIGSILAHACHLIKHGGVFWDLIPPGMYRSEQFSHPEVKDAYFYDVSSGMIQYRATIEFAGALNEIPSIDRYRPYAPPFRTFPRDDSYLLLLTSIGRLDKDYRLNQFKKLDQSKVERVQNYVIIQDPDYPVIFQIR